jgi:NAD(P)-dependent dehydrogenase (short-subunit alcohol dehydrogenase family)
MSLKGKTAIITGSSRGIGPAIAEKLAQRGASVVVNYTLSSAAASEVAQAIIKAGGPSLFKLMCPRPQMSCVCLQKRRECLGNRPSWWPMQGSTPRRR